MVVILVSYNVAAIVYRNVRSRPVGKIYVHAPVPPQPGAKNIINKFKERNGIDELRIGLILAGGGAKGAYQAGRRAP